MRMTNLNDLDFFLCSLNDKESVLYTMMSLEDVIFPNGYVRYLMLSDGNDVVACLKPLEKYEMVGWIVAKGELPGTDGYFRIDKFDSYQSVSFNEWAYGKLAVFNYNTKEVFIISLDLPLTDNDAIEGFLRDICKFRLGEIRWIPFSDDIILIGPGDYR
mgnify:CR=1 FL=1